MLAEDGEQEGPVVQCTVLYSIIKLRNLGYPVSIRLTRRSNFSTHSGRVEFLLLDVAKIFEELFPSFTEKPRFVATTPVHRRGVDTG